WWLEHATAAKLFNHPDRPGVAGARLIPEAASRYSVSRDGKTWPVLIREGPSPSRVSRDGKTWTFFIRKSFRFSDGLPVTAASFKHAIDRVANHDLASPGAPFITDVNGAHIA